MKPFPVVQVLDAPSTRLSKGMREVSALFRECVHNDVCCTAGKYNMNRVDSKSNVQDCQYNEDATLADR